MAWKVNKRGSKRGSSEELELDLIEVLEDENVLMFSNSQIAILLPRCLRRTRVWTRARKEVIS